MYQRRKKPVPARGRRMWPPHALQVKRYDVATGLGAPCLADSVRVPDTLQHGAPRRRTRHVGLVSLGVDGSTRVGG